MAISAGAAILISGIVASATTTAGGAAQVGATKKAGREAREIAAIEKQRQIKKEAEAGELTRLGIRTQQEQLAFQRQQATEERRARERELRALNSQQMASNLINRANKDLAFRSSVVSQFAK